MRTCSQPPRALPAVRTARPVVPVRSAGSRTTPPVNRADNLQYPAAHNIIAKRPALPRYYTRAPEPDVDCKVENEPCRESAVGEWQAVFDHQTPHGTLKKIGAGIKLSKDLQAERTQERDEGASA